MKPVQCKWYLASTADTYGLMLKHQGISSYRADYSELHLYVSRCVWFKFLRDIMFVAYSITASFV